MLVPPFGVDVLWLLDGPSSSGGRQREKSKGQNHVPPVPALQHRPRRGPNCRCAVAIRRIDWTGISLKLPATPLQA